MIAEGTLVGLNSVDVDKDFYDGGTLLSKKDINGNTPEIFSVVGNRTAGKTFYFKRLMSRRWLKNEKKALPFITVRFRYEVKDYIEAFFEDLMDTEDWINDFDCTTRVGGLYSEWYLNGELFGYCGSISSADTFKKYASKFSHTSCQFFDEFQSESEHYVPDEVTKFISLHNSIARGQGKHRRYLPVYMCSNNISILNPYYTAWKVLDRISGNFKFLRCNGLVIEKTFNKTAATLAEESGFNQAFGNHAYFKSSIANEMLLDNNSFIGEPLLGNGRKYNWRLGLKYKYDNIDYGIYHDRDMVFVRNKVDPKYPVTLVVNVQDHDTGSFLMGRNEMIMAKWRELFNNGRVRFENMLCKNSFLNLCAIK